MTMIDAPRKIGYWWPEKKRLQWDVEMKHRFAAKGYELVLIDFDRDIESQGPFVAIVHRLSDILCEARTVRWLKSINGYLAKHPEVIFFEKLSAVHKIIDRRLFFEIIKNSELGKMEERVYVPNYVELSDSDVAANMKRLAKANVHFPVLCKPLSTGFEDSHNMVLVFNEAGLSQIRPPCVAQSFVNHNARLIKIFTIRDAVLMTERPSIKNLSPSDGAIFGDAVSFVTESISRFGSQSPLTKLDEKDLASARANEQPLDTALLNKIASVLSKEFQLQLMGIDVIVENVENGRYGIIDVNYFPSYEGVWHRFFDLFTQLVIDQIETKNSY